ncbi:carbohydrate-binding protein [Sunxiuqinia sp. A32]|uniref:carbohydrate-binding protein n=1 Tax=Sunxiuqinia sp. A32 TaxID=3461496 RepID=UPI004046212F
MNFNFTRLVIVILSLFSLAANMATAQTSEINSGTIYKIKSKKTNRLLNVSDAALTNEANVNTWTDTDSDASKWKVINVEGNTFTLQNIGSGKLLHRDGSSLSNGVNINQYDDTNNDLVQWDIVFADDRYLITPKGNSSFVVDLNGGENSDGANIQIWEANNSDAQDWVFEATTIGDPAPTNEITNIVFDSWKEAYYDTRGNNEVVKQEGFWGVAEMMEIIVDAYEVSRDNKYKEMFEQMYTIFINREGQDWMWNEYNDDIAWMVIACVRAGLLFDNATYIAKAKDQFDKMFSRANTHQYGGQGLVWKQGVAGTNSCINGPAMVACCYLAQATNDISYFDKATTIYEWSKLYLFNEETGKVNDNYNGSIGTWSSTYNQGTYLGASLMLYDYTQDPSYMAIAHKIAYYTKENMYNSGIMNNEEGNDLGGFKGIFMRYARRFVLETHDPEYILWLQQNAKVAYNNRNTQNIIGTYWGTRTPENEYQKAFSASTAMSLMFNCPVSIEISKDAFQLIEAEDMDFFRGVITEDCPDVGGSLSLGGIKNEFYSAYTNVDFGSKVATKIELRIASLSDDNKIEIRLDHPFGKTIGTASTVNTGSWSEYTTVSCDVSGVSGIRNIYLVYKGTDFICNINNFKFIEDDNEFVGSVFPECEFAGEEVKLSVGDYTSSDIQSLGINASEISSIKVSSGYEIIAFLEDDFEGEYMGLSEDNSCLPAAFNESISSLKVRVKSSVAVDQIKLSSNSETLSEEGVTKQLSAKILPWNASNKSYTWKSSDTDVVTVNESGLLQSIAIGNAYVVATTEDGLKTDTCFIEVDNSLWSSKIEAEDYSSMLNIGTEDCAEGTRNVGWIDQNDWMQYDNITFPVTREYRFEFRVATGIGGQLGATLDGLEVGSVTLPVTPGWQSYQTVSFTTTIEAGTYDLRIRDVNGGWNFNWIQIVSISDPTDVTDIQTNDISAYPNPASTTITFGGISESSTVSILDINGHVCLANKSLSGNAQLNIESLRSGLYFAHICDQNSLKVIKFIKK